MISVENYTPLKNRLAIPAQLYMWYFHFQNSHDNDTKSPFCRKVLPQEKLLENTFAHRHWQWRPQGKVIDWAVRGLPTYSNTRAILWTGTLGVRRHLRQPKPKTN